MKLISAVLAALGVAAPAIIPQSPSSPFSVGRRSSRGHGEGCAGNKHAKSSFKQNKRKGL